MRINNDCIRDLLLFLEENLIISKDLEFQSISLEQILESDQINYPAEVIVHTAMLLGDADYIETSTLYADGKVKCLDISNITYAGYQFLDTVRPQSVWDKTKNLCATVGSWSFDTITTIATSVLSQMITHALT